MITAIVPVKVHSERLKDKNFKEFDGTSLYEHKLKQLKHTGFDKVFISSESLEVLDIACKYGFYTHFRDSSYSTSDVPMAKVYSYIASSVPGDDVAWVNVTNPLVGAEHYNEAIDRYHRHKKHYDCLLSVYRLQKYVWWQEMPVNWYPYSDKPHPRSQDLMGLLAMSFAIDILKRDDLIRWGTLVGKHPQFYVLDPYISTKIDYEEDLVVCEALQKLYAGRNDG